MDLVRQYEGRFPNERYLYALICPDRVDIRTDSPRSEERLENPEEVAQWMHVMGLVIDGEEVISELKKWEYSAIDGSTFGGFDRLPDHIVTDLGREMVREGDPPNRYRQAWDEWKKFRATVEEVNADTVTGTRKYEKLGSTSEDTD